MCGTCSVRALGKQVIEEEWSGGSVCGVGWGLWCLVVGHVCRSGVVSCGSRWGCERLFRVKSRRGKVAR